MLTLVKEMGVLDVDNRKRSMAVLILLLDIMK